MREQLLQSLMEFFHGEKTAQSSDEAGWSQGEKRRGRPGKKKPTRMRKKSHHHLVLRPLAMGTSSKSHKASSPKSLDSKSPKGLDSKSPKGLDTKSPKGQRGHHRLAMLEGLHTTGACWRYLQSKGFLWMQCTTGQGAPWLLEKRLAPALVGFWVAKLLGCKEVPNNKGAERRPKNKGAERRPNQQRG